MLDPKGYFLYDALRSFMQNRKPVIALLAPFPLWLVDGAYRQAGWHSATWLVALREMLEDADAYEIHWITFWKQTLRRRVFRYGNQTFHVLPAYSLTYAQKTGYLHARMQVKRELARIQPDIVHAWGTENRFAVSGADFKGKKILSMQGILTACAQRAPMAEFMLRQSRHEAEWISSYDVVTSESEWGLERVRELAPSVRSYRWEYAVRTPFFHAPRQLSETPVCLFGGSDVPLKDLDTAISAFSAPTLSHVRLLLAGPSAEQRPHLPPNIQALGGVGQEKLTELLGGCWCLIHPSMADSCPNIVKEARVMGVPAIVTTECGGKQYVENGLSGFVIKPRDVAGLIQAVKTVCSDRDTAERMGRHGQASCREALSRETMMKELCRLYDNLLKV